MIMPAEMPAITDLGSRQLQLKLQVLNARKALADVRRQITAQIGLQASGEKGGDRLASLRSQRDQLQAEINRLRSERAAIRRQIADEFFGRSGQVVDKQQHSDHHE